MTSRAASSGSPSLGPSRPIETLPWLTSVLSITYTPGVGVVSGCGISGSGFSSGGSVPRVRSSAALSSAGSKSPETATTRLPAPIRRRTRVRHMPGVTLCTEALVGSRFIQKPSP